MEGVGARLGRSSTRYGPPTVFNGPVRRWNKKWIPLSNPNPNSTHHYHTTTTSSHLLLYKWIPLSHATVTGITPAKDSAGDQPERKYRYVPISIIEYQKREPSAKSEEDPKPSESDQSSQPSHADPANMKPDMNNVPLEEFQASDQDQNPTERSGTNLDLSLGLNSEGDPKSDSKISRPSEGGGQGKEANMGTNLQPENKRRKVVTPDLKMRV